MRRDCPRAPLPPKAFPPLGRRQRLNVPTPPTGEAQRRGRRGRDNHHTPQQKTGAPGLAQQHDRGLHYREKYRMTRTLTEAETAGRAAYTAGLRMLADLIDAHPDLILPSTGAPRGIPLQIHCFHDPKAELAAWARALPGTSDKRVEDGYFRVYGLLGGLHVEAWAARNRVCERVVTGVETVVEEVSDPDALARVPRREVAREVETVRWDCAPILAAALDRAGAAS